jgi:uncharacterized protein YjbI with pentapeptide repeats
MDLRMKTLRSIGLFVLVLVVAACAEDSEAPAGSGRGGICTEGASVAREEIEAGGVLCEHQTLVASIRPGDDLKLAFHVFTPGDVDLCFDDDDDEAHEVSLGGQVVTAETPCQAVSLTAGDQILGLRHAMHDVGAQDSAPDVVHTKWTPPTPASRGRLLVATNSCPGCVLTSPWPDLGGHSAGYTGDYTRATIKGTCRGFETDICSLGGHGVTSHFDAANVVFDDQSRTAHVIGDFGRVQTSQTFLQSANVEIHGSTNVYRTIATGAKFSSPGPHDRDDILQFDECQLASVDFTAYVGPEIDFSGSHLDVFSYSALLQRRNAYFTDVTVEVYQFHSLANLIIDGHPDAYSKNIDIEWPRDSAGLLFMNGTSFDKATVRNVSFGCLGGGDLRGASFAGATLENVALTGCDLTGARFTGATLTSVTAAKNTLLTRADLTNVTIDGLDVSDASLSYATLKNASSKPVIGLVARRVTAEGLVARDLVTGLDAKDLGADFTGAILSKANFASAELQRARFTNAALQTTNLSGATLTGASFDGATGFSTNFTGALLGSTGVPRTSLSDVRFEEPSFAGADLRGAKMTGARVCGGRFVGANLRGVDLADTLLPTMSDMFSRAGSIDPPFACVGNQDLVSTTDLTTICPDGMAGECLAGAWVPPYFVPTCVAPKHRASGFPCATACDCNELKCDTASSKCF